MISKTKFVDTIIEGESVTDIFLATDVSIRQTKAGKDYLTFKLKDRTGEISAKSWTMPEIMPTSGQHVKVLGTASTYNGKMELTATRLRPLTADECADPADFVPASPHDRFAQLEELREAADRQIRSPFRELAAHALSLPGFADCPAAKGMHQAFVGGLVDHTLSMYKIADFLCTHYPELDTDVMLTAVIWHDIGKIRELRWKTAIENTPEGRLIGHLGIGLIMLQEAKRAHYDCPAMDKRHEERFLHLMHIVASHHGQRDWGAIQTPMTREAQLFHLIDMIDSRAAGLDAVAKEPVDADGFTAYQRVADGAIWRVKP